MVVVLLVLFLMLYPNMSYRRPQLSFDTSSLSVSQVINIISDRRTYFVPLRTSEPS